MDEKLTLQELIELLTRKHHMEKEDAEMFVQTFFKLIEEALEVDKYVKIKGLGTFKLIEMQGGARISFTPDTTMRELINKPFSHFETIVLNDNTHFEGMREEENISIWSSEMEESFGETATAESVNLQEEDSFREKSEENSSLSDAVNVNATESHISGSSKEFSPEKEPSSIVTHTSRGFTFPWCMLTSILLIGVVVGGGMVWNFFSHKRFVSDSILDSLIYQRLNETVLIELTDRKYDSTKAVVESVSLNKVGTVPLLRSNDTISTQYMEHPEPAVLKKQKKVISSTSSEDKEKKPKSQLCQKEYLSDTVGYQITGTQTTYTLRSGESLVKVAQKFYGNKKLWPYLVKHNKKVIKNADRIPAGTTIEIPVLIPQRK